MAGIDKFAKKVKGAGRRADRAADETAKHIAEMCAAWARNLAKGSIKRSIHVVREGEGRYSVIVDHPGAAYTEFGTGLGPGTMEPFDLEAMKEVGYEVNATGRGEEGWVYVGRFTDDGRPVFYFTHGQPGRGYLAKGVRLAMEDFKDIARAQLKVVLGEDD